MQDNIESDLTESEKDESTFKKTTTQFKAVEDAKKRQIEAGGDRKSEEYQKSHVSDLTQPIEQDYDATKTRTKAAEQAGVLTGALGTYKKLKKNASELAEDFQLVSVLGGHSGKLG